MKPVVSFFIVFFVILVIATYIVQIQSNEFPELFNESEQTPSAEENQSTESPETAETQPQSEPADELPEISLELEFVRKIQANTAVYPGIIFADNHFFIHYEKFRKIHVQKFDSDFNPVGEEIKLSEDEGPDHQMVFGDGFFYLVNSLYLRKFDLEFNEVEKVPYYENLPAEEKEKWPGGIDDMLLYHGNDSVYIGIASGKAPSHLDLGIEDEPDWGSGEKPDDYIMEEKPEGDIMHSDRTEKKPDIPGGILFQKYNSDLELEDGFLIDDLGNTPASSMLFQDNTFTIVCADRHWDDSSIIKVSFDSDWNLIERKVISAIPNVNEEFVMGFASSNGVYFIAYHHITGDLSQPMGGEHIIRNDVILKAFDSDWNLLDEVLVTEDIPDGHENSGNTPHIALNDNKIYVAYAGFDSDRVGTFVKEYEINIESA